MFRRSIRSVVITGGQGDVMMSVNGMIASMKINPSIFSHNVVVYTRSVVLPVVDSLLKNIKVRDISESRHVPRPRYYTSSSTSWTTLFRNWVYPDYYVDFDERVNLQVYGGPKSSLSKRIYLRLTALRFGLSINLKQEDPIYYGIKMWLPIALSYGISEVQLYRSLVKNFHLSSYSSPENQNDYKEVWNNLIAIFPGAGSYQYIPASFIIKIMTSAGVGREKYCCFFEKGDPLIADYEESGMKVYITKTVLDAVAIVQRASVVLTPDSFLSHLAQIYSSKHMALMTHNFPVNTVHPAAHSYVCYHQIDCSPCYYENRSVATTCPKGRRYCEVYDSPEYHDMTVNYISLLL